MRGRSRGIVRVLGAALLAVGPAAAEPPGWARQIGARGPEIGYAIDADSSGVAVAGTFDQAIELGRDRLVAIHQRDLFVARFDSGGEPVWARSLGGRRGDEPRAVALDESGRVWVTGYHLAGLDRAGLGRTRGGADAFLVVLDERGEPLRAWSWGGTDADSGLAVAAAAGGSVWVSGMFQGDVAFGDRLLRARSGRDAFLLRLDAAGRVAAAVALGGPRDDTGTSIAVTEGGSVFWLGRFEESAVLDGRTVEATTAGEPGLFVARVAPSGEVAWIRGLDAEQGAGIAAAARGGAIVGGAFRDALDLSAHGGPRLAGAGGLDGFVAALDRRGRVRWAAGFGGPATDSPHGLDVDPDGRVLVTGSFQGRTDFDPGPAVAELDSADATNADAFLLALDGEGRFETVHRLGDDGAEVGLAVSAAGRRGSYAAGVFNRSLRFAGAELVAAGKTDVFLVHVPTTSATSELAHANRNRDTRAETPRGRVGSTDRDVRTP